MKNKVLTLVLIILICISLVGIIGIALKMQLDKSDKTNIKEASIDEILKSSVDIPEIMTNLSGKQFIRITLKIQTTDKKAAEELKKREFQVQNMVIQELSEMTSKELEGKAGKQAFEDTIKAQLNPLMQKGEIEKVYIVSYIIQ
ncbi:flagellar basal body-associated protein FliL [Sporosarcina thermotolerans]|uniref:Flagellar protein FliL n=1 Tax=Sporosarcina thermotolerans TaxID=633404 RepID=A0AAW9A3N5_9BACL|nr:flagellar basal body-associated protein FliL [Sporosarcina thermotolerans]MDW0115726.1 flagellar basal body-associated protein FliL [Sporosarcina thermotolerans]WHT47019.1 flagellar basal body-associated protein FliL [Sporosarcina thermotolerans]